MGKDIQAIRVNQWLSTWNSVEFKKEKKREKPAPFFYMFSISARALKKLSGVYRRSAKDRTSAAEEFGIQRKHDPNRSETIKEFVKNGYPWSELSEAKQRSGEYEDLKHPGWLPTAIVINILGHDDKRRAKKVAAEDIIEIKDGENGISTIRLPDSFNEESWSFGQLPPIEIIDGQHRLWAFEESDIKETYELPVVAFHGLDISWQAYLFYTINISPKKINRSLAYDLYPLLRTEDWLQKFEGHIIYRETRAQELVDLLYSHPKSPWAGWINMLGDTGGRKMVSQSAWIRSLLASYIKSYEGRGVKIGGIFGAPAGKHETVLHWGKDEQAALLIYIGNYLKENISQNSYSWAESLRMGKQLELVDENKDIAFYGSNSLLNQDQGLRALLYVTNDFLYLLYDDLELEDMFTSQLSGSQEEIISANITEIYHADKLAGILNKLLNAIAMFDWRSYGASGLDEEKEKIKRGYRGSGGYKVLRIDLLEFIINNSNDKTINKVAKNIIHTIQ